MLGQHQLIVVGGSDSFMTFDTTEVLDLEKMEFAPGPRLTCRRACCAVATVGERWLLVFGGFNRPHRLDTTEILDLTSMAFEPGPRMTTRRAACAALAC
mmetsp:Transcript_33042/g.76848  ORF Transcript_33042/g.76848 Transcript_33042/m.76848 type:complete len:99 (-) Transcript_33042:121-417(-)|eukprot:CAMPEP_0171144330 /NCGR_PEP_ID=MMETSP0766_2-20121228/145750_1 /TAXON_ID=439317 /ORGANISM="Gambierdiscus australes, Strain CAWD 149" /LENGTH=98 /DNA_ID=CAMNT_0011608185 /DNA_START=24 /DNA_END=320 /DNA_ORIENTATION=-